MKIGDRPQHLAFVFDWHAERHRQSHLYVDRPFDIAPEGGVEYNGEQLALLVRSTAGWLYGYGLRAGDRVAIIKDNGLDTVLLGAAAARFGAVPAVLAAKNDPAVHRALIDRLRPKLLVTSPGVLERAAVAGIDLSADVATVVLGEIPDVPAAGRLIRLDDVRGPTSAPVKPNQDSEPIYMTHTSGTTGVPKLVVQSAQSYLHGTRLETLPLPLVSSRRRDVTFSAISYAHWRAVTWITAQFKFAPRRLIASGDDSPETAVRLFTAHVPTSVEASPNVFQRWKPLTVSHPVLFAQVRLYMSTFDLIHPPAVRAFLNASRRAMPIWVQSWGQSEVGAISSSIFTRSRMRRTGRPSTNDVGWSVPGLAKVKVADPHTGRRRLLGQRGILMVANTARCIDYLGESERHAEKANGMWWNTGDMGYRDLLWRIKMVDREVDMIPGLSGIGIESVLLERLERATEVVVLGAPGELPLPVISLSGDPLSDSEWHGATQGLPNLAPPVVVPWDEIPRTATWKVRRADLREMVTHSTATYGSGRWT